MDKLPWLPSRQLAMSLLVIVSVLAIAEGVTPRASARPWKPTPLALAQDYLIINDNRHDGSVVVMMWIAPPMLQGTASETSVYDQYVVLGIVHGFVSTAGTMSFEPIDSLQPASSDGSGLLPAMEETMPPVLKGGLVAVKAGFEQALGPLGHGMHWFVFNAGAVHACAKGGMSVPYEGETYTYDTPVPGCPGT